MGKIFNYFALLCLSVAAFCACGEKALTGVGFPEPPIEIASNESLGMGLVNYFNIIQTPDGTYRMYFAANENSGIAEDEWQQNLYLAESADGFHYEMKGKIMESLIEQSVCLVKDKEWPYRLIGNQLIDGKHCLCLWKSKDGIEFTERKVLYDFKHDTQNILVQHGDRLKLYSRLTQEHYQNRRVTLTIASAAPISLAVAAKAPANMKIQTMSSRFSLPAPREKIAIRSENDTPRVRATPTMADTTKINNNGALLTPP